MEPNNRQRADRFAVVLRTYGTDDTPPGCLTDLLADARHWCHQNDKDYSEYDQRAEDHFHAEIDDEGRRS